MRFFQRKSGDFCRYHLGICSKRVSIPVDRDQQMAIDDVGKVIVGASVQDGPVAETFKSEDVRKEKR